MSTWLIPIEEMSQEQRRAIELSPNEHRLILGAPGSGKTQILLHRAKYLRDEFQVPPDRFHIFVFTNVLKSYIQSALDLLSLPQNCITTLDHWCRTCHEQYIGRVPWNAAAEKPDFAATRRAVLAAIESGRILKPLFDFVLVDEGQDLEKDCFDLLRAVAKHVTVCIDHKQQLYDHGSDEDEIVRRLGLRKRNMTLLEAFRCCPYIVRMAAQFVADPNEREAFIRQTRTAQTQIETPLYYIADDFEDEKRRLHEVLRVRLRMGERIGILVPLKKQVFGFAAGLKEAGFEIEAQDKPDFANIKPKVLSYHSAKGLTFDTVLLPRLVAASFPKMTDHRIERLLYVGMTRATNWVFLSRTLGTEMSALKRLRALADDRQVTIQRGSPLVAEPVKPTPAGEGDVLDLI